MKRFLVILLALVVVLVAAVAAAPFLLPSSMIAKFAADAVREQTGRELTIDGPIERAVFPTVRIATGPITLSNADWAETDDMVSVERFEAAVKFWPLLSGDVEIETLRIVRPVANLEVRDDGLANWEMAAAEQDGSSDVGAGGGGADVAEDSLLSLALAEIVDGSVSYVDRAGGQTIKLDDINATADLPSLNDPLTLNGTANWNGAATALDARVATLAAAQAGEPIDATLSLSAPGLSLEFDGSAAAPTEGGAPTAAGTFGAMLSADAAETAWLRQSLPPALDSLGAVSLTGTVDASATGLAVDIGGDVDVSGRKTTIVLDASADAGWETGATPIALDLSAANDVLDAGYDGTVAAPPDGPPLATGAYRLRAGDAQALIDWLSVLAGQDLAGDVEQLANLGAIDLSGEIDFSDAAAATLAGDVRYNDRKVTVSADVAGGADWDDGGPIRTTLDVSSGPLLTVSWAGDAALPSSGSTADGRLSISAPRLRALANWSGFGPLKAPQGTFKSLEATLDIDASPTAAAVVIEALTLDDKQATGRLSADLSGAIPSVDMSLTTGPLDLRPFLASGAGGGGSAGGGDANSGAQSGWSDEPLDLSGLRGVDARFDVLADAVTTDTVKLGRSQIDGVLKDGVLRMTVEELGLYGGGAKGAAVIDASGDTARIDADIDASAIQMLPFLKDVADLGLLEGLGRVRLDVQGAGGSMASLMRSLNGDGELRFEDGAIYGVNLAAMVRNLGPSFFTATAEEPRKTDFTELSGTFTIEDGVLSNLDLKMLGPLLRLVGEGRIDLAAQTLDYRLTPRAVASLTGQGGSADTAGLSFPVLVSGSWSNPSFRPDLEGAIGGLLTNPEGAVEGVRSLLQGGQGAIGDGIDGVVGGVVDGLTGGGGANGETNENDAETAPPAPPKPADLIRGLFGN